LIVCVCVSVGVCEPVCVWVGGRVGPVVLSIQSTPIFLHQQLTSKSKSDEPTKQCCAPPASVCLCVEVFVCGSCVCV
jgi:hypothetical protein